MKGKQDGDINHVNNSRTYYEYGQACHTLERWRNHHREINCHVSPVVTSCNKMYPTKKIHGKYT